jgi:hypothetical protein
MPSDIENATTIPIYLCRIYNARPADEFDPVRNSDAESMRRERPIPKDVTSYSKGREVSRLMPLRDLFIPRMPGRRLPGSSARSRRLAMSPVWSCPASPGAAGCKNWIARSYISASSAVPMLPSDMASICVRCSVGHDSRDPRTASWRFRWRRCSVPPVSDHQPAAVEPALQTRR